MNGVEVVASWFTPAVLFCVLNLMIGTIFFRSTLKQPPRTHHQQPPPQLDRDSSFFERVKSFNLSRYESSQPDPPDHEELRPHKTEEIRRHEDATEEIRHAETEEVHHHETEEAAHHVMRSKSDAVEKVAPAARVLQKSFSVRVSTEKEEEDEERRRPETARERTVAEDEAEDELAGDFINRFRQQLKLQRLDSLLRIRSAGR